jgi:hypothetical protein
MIALPSPTLSATLVGRPCLKIVPKEAFNSDFLHLEYKYRSSLTKAFHALRLGAVLAAINVYESRQARDGQELMSAQRAQNVPGPAFAKHHPNIHGVQRLRDS